MTILDQEQQDTRFDDLARRLSHQSVVKHFDAYGDIDWDSPELRDRAGRSALRVRAREPARRHRVVPRRARSRCGPGSGCTRSSAT